MSPLADAIAEIAVRESPWRRAFLSQIAPQSGDVIIEIGCGRGELTMLMAAAAPGATIIAIDADENAIAQAVERANVASTQVRFIRGDARDLPQLTAAWAPNKIVSSLLMHGMRAHEQMIILRAARSALRKGGALHCAEYGVQSTALMRTLLRAFQGIEITDARALTKLMRDAGFQAVDESRRIDSATGTVSLFSGRTEF
ncbi:MAG: class I SAM-dependent methyltransferase [Caulobacterales bacterium]